MLLLINLGRGNWIFATFGQIGINEYRLYIRHLQRDCVVLHEKCVWRPLLECENIIASQTLTHRSYTQPPHGFHPCVGRMPATWIGGGGGCTARVHNVHVLSHLCDDILERILNFI